jgi:hypothetical protein
MKKAAFAILSALILLLSGCAPPSPTPAPGRTGEFERVPTVESEEGCARAELEDWLEVIGERSAAFMDYAARNVETDDPAETAAALEKIERTLINTKRPVPECGRAAHEAALALMREVIDAYERAANGEGRDVLRTFMQEANVSYEALSAELDALTDRLSEMYGLRRADQEP